MRIEQLLAFKTVADEKSYTRAAEREFLTQPAIYSQVRQLEAECGAKLFYTLGKQVLLTEAGRDLYQLAEDVERAHATYNARFEQRRLKSNHVVRIGAHAFFGVIRDAARRFAAADPAGTVELNTMRPAEAADAIRGGRVDFGFFGDGYSKDGLTFEQCAQNRIVCVAPASHPMVGRRLTFAEFAAEPIVSYAKGPGSARAAIDAWLVENEERATYIAQADGSIGVKTLAVALGVGAMVVRASVQDEVSNGTLAILDVQDFTPSYPLYMIYDTEDELGPAARAFRTHVLEIWAEHQARAALLPPRVRTAVERAPVYC